MEGNTNSDAGRNQRALYYQNNEPGSPNEQNSASDSDNNADLAANQNVSLGDTKTDMIMESDQIESCRLFGMSYFFIRISIEYFVASFFTLLAIEWRSLREFVVNHQGLIQGILFFLFLVYCVHFLWIREVTTMVGKYRHFFQLLRMVCITGFLILMAISFPKVFDILSSYWIVVAGFTLTVTLLLCAFLTGGQKLQVQSKGWGLWFYSLAPPLFILLVSQIFYFMLNVNYANFISDMMAGIILSILFASLYVKSFQGYVNSPKFEQLIAKSEHLSSFINYLTQRNLRV